MCSPNVTFFLETSSENLLCNWRLALCSLTQQTMASALASNHHTARKMTLMTSNQVLQGLVERRPVQSAAIHIVQEKRPQLLRQPCWSSRSRLLQPSPFIRPRQTSGPGQKRSQNLAQTAGRLHTAAGLAAPRFAAHPEGATCGQPGRPRPESPGPPQHPPRRASASNTHLWPQASRSRPEEAFVFRAR